MIYPCPAKDHTVYQNPPLIGPIEHSLDPPAQLRGFLGVPLAPYVLLGPEAGGPIRGLRYLRVNAALGGTKFNPPPALPSLFEHTHTERERERDKTHHTQHTWYGLKGF